MQYIQQNNIRFDTIGIDLEVRSFFETLGPDTVRDFLENQSFSCFFQRLLLLSINFLSQRLGQKGARDAEESLLEELSTLERKIEECLNEEDPIQSKIIEENYFLREDNLLQVSEKNLQGLVRELKEFSESLDENRIEFEKDSLKTLINEFESEYQNKLIDWASLKKQSFIPFEDPLWAENRKNNKFSYQTHSVELHPDFNDPKLGPLVKSLLSQILGTDSELSKENITKAKFQLIELKTQIYMLEKSNESRQITQSS